MLTRQDKFNRRKERVRTKLSRVRASRLRLSVFRSNENIYAQIIDDSKRITLAAASSLDKSLKSKLKRGSTVEAAQQVGGLIADRAKKAGIKEVFFDRGGRLYHGRIKALAESAREKGLEF